MDFELIIILLFLLSGVFVWYVSPDRRENPTRIQTFIAKLWIVIRRVISFTGAGFCVFASYIYWNSGVGIENKITGIIIIIILLLLAIFFIYVGIFGQGWNQYSFKDDLKLYKKIKEKYKIRW